MSIRARRDAEKRRRLRFVSNSSPTQTTGRLFHSLAEGARSASTSAELEYRQLPRGIWPKVLEMRRGELRNLRELRTCDVLVLHTPLALSVVSIVAARLLGKRVIAYVWDMHPESTRLIGTLRNPWALRAYWVVERLALQMSSQIVIASTDYLTAVRPWRRKVKVVPLWPSDEPTTPEVAEDRDPNVLNLGFAGQINVIRGLESGIDEILRSWQGRTVRLHIFSKDDVPEEFTHRVQAEPRLEMELRGELSPEKLQSELGKLDAGWVCLDPSFSLPAFPSKSMAYLSAGIPVLYTGPRLAGFEEWLETNGLGLVTRSACLAPSDFSSWALQVLANRDSYFERMQNTWYKL